MTSHWPMVPLGEVLIPVNRPEHVDPEKVYRLLGARWYARGLYTKEVKSGSEIAASRLYRVEEGDFVYNRLFAWKGSFALASSENAGCYVSNEFPCFRPVSERLDGRFLWHYFSREVAWSEALGLSTGGTPTSRNRLKEASLLAMRIPLPPLTEQNRIAAHIRQITERIEGATRLQQEQSRLATELLNAAFWRIAKAAPRVPMADVAPLIRRPVEVTPADSYPELGIRSFGNGTFHKPSLTGLELGAKRVFHIEPGDLLFTNVFAWEGAIAVARPEDAGRVGSHRFITCVPVKGVATANFLRFYFLTSEGLQRIGAASPGGAGRNRTLGLKALLGLNVPVPSYRQQCWFDELHGQFDAEGSSAVERAETLHALQTSTVSQLLPGIACR